MAEHTIALQFQDRSPRAKKAKDDLCAALGGASCTDPDEGGAFEVRFPAESQEEALQKVWNAVAATGADDHLVIMEHPHVERHWEHRADGAHPT
jgi:hypothetical protein